MKKRNLTKRQAQAIKTKKKIYSEAMKLMNKKGFDDTTIADISKKAGVSVGAFYHYYKSKNDIFFELYKKADDFFKNKVSCQLTENNSLDQIVSFFKFYANYNYQRGLDAIRQLYNTKNKLFIAKGRYMHILLEKIIKKGQEKNEISSEMTPECMANYLFISARGIVYDWCLHDGDYDLEEATVKYIKRLVVIFKNI